MRLSKFGYYTGWIHGGILILLRVPTFVGVTTMILDAIAPGVLTLIFPPTFGASFLDDVVNFEFKSRIVAEELLRLNSGASIKNSDGKLKFGF